MGTNWSGPELLCNSTLEPDHPILQQCIRKGGMMDVPPGWGVSGVHLAHDGGRLQPLGHKAM